MRSATAFVPGSVGNVGPGFDVLGLAFDGAGDRVSLSLSDDARFSISVTGRDSEKLSTDPAKNTAAISARSFLLSAGSKAGATIALEKGLALSGGMGGSAASAVAGAAAASFALFEELKLDMVIRAALEGEKFASGHHLDNILPSALGGLALARSIDPLDYVALPVAEDWWVTIVTPEVRIETREARSILEPTLDRRLAIQQIANVAAMVHAFATGDAALLLRALDDQYAEPRRKTLIPHFDEVKFAAIANGSIGCSISGSGPSVFSIAPNEDVARRCGEGMRAAFRPLESRVHCGSIARKGARRE